MNDNEIKPLYIPTDSGNPLPDLGKHGAHNETPIPLHRTRTEPSRAMSDSPSYTYKHLLPTGDELRDIIRKRIASMPQSPMALWESLSHAYQVQQRRQDSVLQAIAAMINNGDLETRDGMIHVADKPADEPPEDDVDELPEEMWTMTHTQRLMHVLGEEPQTREALARQTGLKPRQVSKAAYFLIQQGLIEVVGDVPRTWRRTQPMSTRELWAAINQDAEPETAVLTEEQTRAVVLERVGRAYAMTEPVIADVMRLSGWDEGGVAMLIDTLAAAGDLDIHADGSISRAAVKSEDPPEYEIGDEDDGEIPEPGISRPGTRPYVLDSATIDFVQRDSGGYVTDECSVTIDADGLSFGGGDVMPFAAIDALMPVLRRVHRAIFGGDE